MARKVELAVGQERELKSARPKDRGKARVVILGLNQRAELYGGSGSSYRFWKLHDDMVHVRILEVHDWSWWTSSRQTRERPTERNTDVASYASHSRKWRWERLPEGEYLVKAALIGSIWGDEQNAEQEHARRVEEARRIYDAAVERQREQLTRYFVGARVDATPIAWGHSGTLSLNALAAVINHAAGRQIVNECHWRDYEPRPADEVA